MKTEIVPLYTSYQPAVDELLESIDSEYELEFRSPNGMKMTEINELPGRKYWAALVNGKLVGTVGVIIQDGYATLKSMFLHKDYRGGNAQIAIQLLQTAIDAGKRAECAMMYLGTMAQFKAAQRFYEKQGFVRIDEKELPANFPKNVVDTVFFKQSLL